MENNFTQYSDELKKTDPTSPFYDEIRKTELQIDILQETKSSVTNKNELINQLKTKLEELKRQQNLRETSDNFGELKKTELEDLNKQKEPKELSEPNRILNEYRRPRYLSSSQQWGEYSPPDEKDLEERVQYYKKEYEKKTELEDLNKQKKHELSLKFPIKNETERLKKIAEIDKEYDKLVDEQKEKEEDLESRKIYAEIEAKNALSKANKKWWEFWK
jgi:hypothetical protein